MASGVGAAAMAVVQPESGVAAVRPLSAGPGAGAVGVDGGVGVLPVPMPVPASVTGVLAAPEGELAPLSGTLAPLDGVPGVEMAVPSALLESLSPPQPVNARRKAKDREDTVSRAAGLDGTTAERRRPDVWL